MSFAPPIFNESAEVRIVGEATTRDPNVLAALHRVEQLAADPTRRHVQGSRALTRPLVEAMRIAFHVGVGVADLADMVDTRDETAARALAGLSWRGASGPIARLKEVGL